MQEPRNTHEKATSWQLYKIVPTGTRVMLRSSYQVRIKAFCEFTFPHACKFQEVTPSLYQAEFSSDEWRKICAFAEKFTYSALDYIESSDQHTLTLNLCRLVQRVVNETGRGRQFKPHLLPLLPPTASKTCISKQSGQFASKGGKPKIPLITTHDKQKPAFPTQESTIVHAKLPISASETTEISTKEWRRPLKPIQPEPICEKADLEEIARFVLIFEAASFQPTEDVFCDGLLRTLRHPAIIDFQITMQKSSVILTREWLTQSPDFSSAQRKCWLNCVVNPEILSELDSTSLRWQISAIHHSHTLKTLVSIFFEKLYFPQLLRRFCEIQAVSFDSMNIRIEVEDYRKEMYEGSTKYIGFMIRDHNGTFGSIPLYDDFSDEGNAYDNDNDWIDRL